MKPRLIKMPDGSWINPECITAIRVCERTEKDFICQTTVPDRVVVDFSAGGIGNCACFNCDDLDQAKALADQFAEVCNGSRYEINLFPVE